MFVTRTSLRGLTQICGAFSLHFALFMTIMLYYPKGDFSDGEKEFGTQETMPDESMRKLMIGTHAMLMLSLFTVSQNLGEDIIQQILCYTSALLYFFMISVIVQEIFAQPPIASFADDIDRMMRYLFLVVEFGAFLSILMCNAAFLAVRMLTPNQINLVKVEPRRQMPSMDTMDSLTHLITQYSGFCVPFFLTMAMQERVKQNGGDAESVVGMLDFEIGQGIQVVLINVLIFFSWKKGPSLWLKVAPKLYYGLAIVAYLVIPITLLIRVNMKWEEMKLNPFFLVIFFGTVVQIWHILHFYLTVYKEVLPEAKAYIEKRERKNLIDEQLGSPSQRAARKQQEQLNANKSGQNQYVELKELTRQVNGNSSVAANDLSRDRLMTEAETGMDQFEGFGSFTDYSALEGEPVDEDDFVDEANNKIAYSQQKRGFGEGEIRLGKSLSLSENIYTLAFMAELTNEEIDRVTREDQGKPPQAKDLRTTPRGTPIGFEEFDENDPSFLEAEAEIIQWEEETMKRYETWKQERIRLVVHVFVTAVSQIALLFLLFRETVDSLSLMEIISTNISVPLLTSKGICAIILHLDMQINLTQGNEMMKYALNHQKRFLSYHAAFKLGLFRTLTTLSVETISLLIVFTSETVSDVVFNFIALAVIDQFDIFVYESLRCSFKDLLEEDLQEKLLKISFTTSSRALSGEMGENSDWNDEDGKPVCNKIRFWHDRSLFNKTYWLIYKMMRFWYVVAYFYFYPLMVVFGNYFVCWYLTTAENPEDPMPLDHAVEPPQGQTTSLMV